MLSLLVNAVQHKKYPVFAKRNFATLLDNIKPMFFESKTELNAHAFSDKNQMIMRLPSDLMQGYQERAINELKSNNLDLVIDITKNNLPILFVKPNEDFSDFMHKVELKTGDVVDLYYLNVVKMIHGKQIQDGIKELNLNISININGTVENRIVGIVPRELISTLETKIIDSIKMNFTDQAFKPIPIMRKNAPRM